MKLNFNIVFMTLEYRLTYICICTCTLLSLFSISVLLGAQAWSDPGTL